MLRVGYPAVFGPELMKVMPQGVELVPLDASLDHEEHIDVWLPDPYPTRSQRIWPHLRGVRLVLALMAGTEWIPSTVGPHVTICNAHGAHNISTAEWTVSAMLAMLKNFPLFLDIQRSGDWRRRTEATAAFESLHPGERNIYPPVMQEELTGKTVLLVGHGAIGQEIERMLGPFRVNVLRVARTERSEPPVLPVARLDTVIPQADIIVLILPLTADSRGLFGAQQFALMKQGALLVNSARGGVVVTDALVDALRSGRIRAAIDVTDPEPLPQGHALWQCPNLLITPHVAGSTPQFAPRSLQTAADELGRYLRGEPLRNVVQAAS